jgi:hypothetical protein
LHQPVKNGIKLKLMSIGDIPDKYMILLEKIIKELHPTV